MKRRDFLTTACVAGLAAASMKTATAAQALAAQPPAGPQFLDFRMTTAPNAQRLDALVKYTGETVNPIMNRHGISPIGLFVADAALNAKEAAYDKKYDNMLFHLIPHANLNSIMELGGRLRGDTQYIDGLTASSQGRSSRDPAYSAQERMLLRCFPESPTVNVPSVNPNRIFQLRLYRSHDAQRNWAKAHQIGRADGGALSLFEECGIKTVFMSSTLYSSFMPSLIFMLCFESEEQKNDAWAKFINHPGWRRLASDPAYADTATEIINIYLKPCAGSQI